jgi:hypothetical protein
MKKTSQFIIYKLTYVSKTHLVPQSEGLKAWMQPNASILKKW